MGTFLHLLAVLFFAALFIGGYITAPALAVWGWARWVHARTQTVSSILSLVGLAFATASIICAAALLVYSRSLGGGMEHFNDPFFMKIFFGGKLLSGIGIAFGIAGLWKPSVLRWVTPVCTLSTLMFWLITGGN